MKNIIIGAIVLSLCATPAFAKVKVRDLLIGGVIGAVLVESYKDAKKYPNYNYNYNSYDYNYSDSYDRRDPCNYYITRQSSYRYNSDRAEYERGVAARLCQEQQDRHRRAFDCGYNGTCQ